MSVDTCPLVSADRLEQYHIMEWNEAIPIPRIGGKGGIGFFLVLLECSFFGLPRQHA